MKKAITVAITLLMLMSGMFVVMNGGVGSKTSRQILSVPENPAPMLTSHAPIRINNNSDLASAASSGSGTQAEPYIIENYEIDATGYNYGIFIGNTTNYFTIQNCSIYGASYVSMPYSVGASIELYNNSGGAFIFNNTLNGNRYGIYADNTNYTGSNNRMEANKVGMFSYNSLCHIYNSTVIPSQSQNSEYYIPIDSYPYSGGDYIDYLANATYTKLFNITNEVYFDTHIWGYSDAPDLDLAIFLDGKDGSPKDGQAQKSEFVQYSAKEGSDEEVELDLPASGTYIIKVAGYDVTGNPGHFDMQITTRSGYEGLLTEYSQNILINTTIQDLSYGIVSIDSNITGNTTVISGASYAAVITDSTRGNFSFLSVKYNTYGIYLQNCSSVDIYGNLIVSNSDYGVYLDNRSNGNRIWRNEFYMNKNTHHYFMDGYSTQAFDGGNNYWNYTNIGNFWLDWAENNETNDMDHDGIVDWPYPLDGAFDYYPMKNSTYDKAGPSFNVICPGESSNIHDPLPVIQVKISDDLIGVNKGSISIWLDGSLMNDTLIPDNSDYTYTLTTMPSSRIEAGNHFINISASDIAGNPSTFSWNFTITDAEAPEITHNGYEMNSVGNSTDIYADIDDDFGVKTATLWYKGVGDSTFSSSAMIFNGDEWVGTIPPQSPTGVVDYYIEASDGTNAVSSPTYSEHILSNEGMIIRHHPVGQAEAGMVIPIEADVIGASYVTLWHKEGSSGYVPVAMNNGGLGNTYYGYIPPQDAGQKIYYYIEAQNSTGTLTSPINTSTPYEINITGVGTLRVAMQDGMKTLNPITAADLWTRDVMKWCFDGLTWQNTSNKDHIEPRAAEWFHHGPNSTWGAEPYPDNDNNTDYLNWTVKLRPDIKWHDWESQTGNDQYVRAHDVIFSLRLQADVGRYADSIDCVVARNPDGSIMYGKDIDTNTSNGIINGVNVSFEKDYPDLPVVLVTADTDGLTLHYHLKEVDTYFTTDTLNIQVFPERIWKNHISDKLTWSDPQALISFGQFKFEYWNSTSQISEINAFEDYFEKRAKISGMHFSVMDGQDKSSAAILSLTRDKAEYIAWSMGIPQAEYSYDFSDVEIERGSDLGFYYLAFNMRDPDFGYADYNDTDVPAPGQEPTYNHGNYTDIGKPFRLAIAHLINKTYIVENLLKGYGNIEDSVVTDANLFWHDPNVRSYVYDPAEAASILDSAGYVDTDGNGIRELPNRGEDPIYILTPPRYYDPVRAKIGDLIQENATAIGLNVVSMPTDFGTIVNKISNHDFDMYILGWSIPSTISSASAPCDFFGSKHDGGGNNYPGYHNRSFDELCEQFNTESDINIEKQTDSQLQRAVGYDEPYVTMYSKSVLEAHTENFVGWFVKYGGIYNVESMSNITSPDTIKVVSIPHSRPVGESTEITAIITSHVPVSEVWLNYTNVDGVSYNVSMTCSGGNTYVYTIPAQPHSGAVTYAIYAINSYNHTAEEDCSWSFAVTSNMSSENITLHPGWNLVTIRWSGEPVDINTALSGNWTRAMVYMNGQWYTYNKNREAKYNAGFPKLNSTIGLWIYSPSSDSLISYYLSTPTSTKIHLHRGWNLVGYPSSHDAKVSDALSGIQWVHLQTADADGNIYSLTSDDYLIANRAYWIYVIEDSTWTVEW